MNHNYVNHSESNVNYMNCALCYGAPWLYQAPAGKPRPRESLGEEQRGQSCWRWGSLSQHTQPTGLSTNNWQKCPSYQPWSWQRLSTIQASAGRATQHWTGNPGASYTALVIISSRECWRGQPGVTLYLTCQWWMWSQCQPGLIFCDHNWIQDLEEGWEGKQQSYNSGFQEKKLQFIQGVAK